MLVFHNASNTSYANYADNITSISSATGAITLRFLGQGAAATATSTDAIVLSVTSGKEEEMIELIAGAVAESRSAVTVIADDQNSKYISGHITAVDSISLDNGAGTFKNVIPATFTTADTGGVDNAIVVTNADSGSVFRVDATMDAASVITLPTNPVDGFNAKFVCKVASNANSITIAGAFYGLTIQNDAHVPHALGTTSAVIANEDFKLGDFFEIVYDGAAYAISGSFDTASSLSVS